MSSNNPNSVTEIHLLGFDEIRKRWTWFVLLGLILILIGIAAVGHSVTTTVVSMIFIGWLMIIGGLFQTLHAIVSKGWGGFFLDLLTGLLYTTAGFLVVAKPGVAAEAFTLFIAILLVFGGVFRLVLAMSVRFHVSVWLIVHGLISLLLGMCIWQDWPVSGLWVIGMFVGIDMIFNGWTLVMLGLVMKNLPKPTPSV